MRTHNTFLDFSDQPRIIERAGRLRLISSDPCILSPSSLGTDATVDSVLVPAEVSSLPVSDKHVAGGGKPTKTPGTVHPMKVWVGALPSHVDEHCLFTYMSNFGVVKSVVVKRLASTGESRGYGYVRYRERPNPEMFVCEHHWPVGGKLIRIKAYEKNPCWKNEYFSDDEAENEWVPGAD